MKSQYEGYDYPKPEKQSKVFTDHGYHREDPYYWMKDRENPQVINYLKKENVLADKFFAEQKPLIDELF